MSPRDASVTARPRRLVHGPRVLAVALGLFSALGFAADRPKLGVFVVIDQLSAADFRARLPSARFGFKRLVAEGHHVQDAIYDAAPTVTAVGHATLLTGAQPSVHGIVGNEWYDAELGQMRLPGEDPAFQILGRDPGKRDGTAPTLLRAPTLGETVKLHDAKAKAVTVSGKDRSAIMSAGHVADAVVWFDTDRPMFVTSTYYAKTLPTFLAPANEALTLAVMKGTFRWPGMGKQPPKKDGEYPADDPSIQGAIDRAEVDVALAAVKELGLGRDEVPDLLTISFSGHDRVGHAFGPTALESLAEFENTDKELGRLLDGLDKAVGKGKYVLVLSADHGVAPLPTALQKVGASAGYVDTKALRELLEKEADAALGAKDWLLAAKAPGFSVNQPLKPKLFSAIERLRAVALAQPGVAALWTSDEVFNGFAGEFGDSLKRGYVAGRSPDLIIQTKPHWIYGVGDPTAHSTHYNYDRLVPAIFFGPGVGRGRSLRARTIDLAPTLAFLLGVPPPPAAQGEVLDAVVSLSGPGAKPR